MLCGVSVGASTRARPTDTQLLDAACEEFSEHGFPATTMARVARRANSTKPTLYAHFGSKDQLFATLLERESNALRDWLFDAYEAAATLPAADAIRADVSAFFDYAAAHPNGFRLLFGADNTGLVSSVRQRLLDEITAQIAGRLRDYQDATRPVTAVHLQVAAMVVGVALHGAEHAMAKHPTKMVSSSNLAASFIVGALLGLDATTPQTSR